MSRVTRRRFVQTVAASAAFSTFTIAGTKSSGKVLGANDTIRIGVAGLNGRGSAHVGEFAPMKNVQVTHLIDPDIRTWAARTKQVQDKGGNTPKTMQDIREALDDPNLDAISVATPNHWHSLISIWACAAGKDVYVEKPLSHNVREGRLLVDAALKHKRIVQHGTQNRGGENWAKQAREIAAGERGKLAISRGTCFKPRGSIGFKDMGDAPKEVNFDIWLGPAPQQAFHGNLVHYNWHWFWDFGNGDIGNQGVHQMDVARWMIPGATLPKSVISVGGRFGYKDQGQTPNTQLTVFDYGDSLLVFEVRGLKTEKGDGGVGNTVHFESGASGKAKAATEFTGVKSPIAPRAGGGVFHNFIACMRSRNTAEQDAHVLEGHYSSALCHLANISYRLGENLPFSQSSKAFGDNKDVYAMFERMQDHLKDNGVTLSETMYRVGRKLTIDAATESIVGDDQANAMLGREYRKPYAPTA